MAQRIIPAPQSTAGWDAAKRTAIKGLERISINSADQIRNYIPLIYKPKKFSELSIVYPIYSGMKNAVAWDGKSVITPQGIAYLWDVTAQVYLYANGTEYTFESELWDIYGMRSKQAKELGKSLSYKEQLTAFSFLNNAFTTAWSDGVYFFHASHPKSTQIGGTFSNIVSGGFAFDTFLDALILGENMVDPLNRPIYQEAERLFVHSTKVPYARMVINASLNWRGGSANNDENPFKRHGRVSAEDFVVGVPSAYGWSTTQWAVKFSGSELYHNPQVPIKMLKPEDTPAHGVKQDGVFANAFWAEGVTGWVGSTGL